MRTRAITGFFFVAVMLAAVLTGPIFFSGFFLVLSIFSLLEFYKIVRTDDVRPNQPGGVLLSLALFVPLIMHFTDNGPLSNIFIALPVLFIICFSELYRKGAKPFHSVAYTLFGVIMVVMPFCFYVASAFLSGEYNKHIAMGVLIMLWSSDTGAYLAGRSFGKHKLFERHSPKKTWEGLFGGFVLSVFASFVLAMFYPEISLHYWAICSILIVFCGTAGDLFESMLKRSMDIKDSGSILPGHGGLLDRFDGLLMSAPLVFSVLYYFYNS